MKKTITKLIAIVLVIIVTFSTTACGLTEEKAYDNQQINDFAKLSQQTYTSKIKEINQTTQNPSTPIVFTDVESLPPDPKALEAWQYASHVPGFKIRLLRKAATATAKDITAFNMDSSIIYGGSLIKIEDPEQFGSFTAMQCKRAPMTLSLNLYASPNVDFNPVTVENTLDGFRGGVNKLFSQTFKKGAIIPQQFAIEPHIVESEEQISSLLGLSNDIDVGKTKGGVSLIEALDYGEPSDASKNKPRQIKAILIVKQVFANVSVSYPGSASGYLDKSVSDKDFKNDLQNVALDNGLESALPAVVSQVALGRMALITIVANAEKITEQQLLSKLSTTFGKSEDPFTTAQSSKYNEFMKSIEGVQQYFILGGSQEMNKNDFLQRNSVIDIASEFRNQDMSTVAASELSYTVSTLDGRILKELPSAVYYTAEYVPIMIQAMTYLGALNISKTKPVSLNGMFKVEPNDAYVNSNSMIYTVLSGNANSDSGIITLNDNAAVGEVVNIKVSTGGKYPFITLVTLQIVG